MLAVSTFLTCQSVTMHVRDHNVGIYYQLSLQGDVSKYQTVQTRRTLKT